MSFSLWSLSALSTNHFYEAILQIWRDSEERLSALRQTIVRLWSHLSIYWSSRTMRHCEHWEKSSEGSPNFYRSAMIDLLSAKAFGESIRLFARRHAPRHNQLHELFLHSATSKTRLSVTRRLYFLCFSVCLGVSMSPFCTVLCASIRLPMGGLRWIIMRWFSRCILASLSFQKSVFYPYLSWISRAVFFTSTYLW